MEHCQWVFHLPLNACTRHGQSSFTHLTSYIRLSHLTTLNSFLRDIDHSLTASLTASMVGYLDPCTTSFSLYSDCRQYLTFIFSSQESAVDTEYRKRVLKRPHACTKTKEGSVKNAWSSDHTREMLDIKMASRISLPNFGQHTRQVII